MTAEVRFYFLLAKMFGFIFLVVFLLLFLRAMFRREAVKQDLQARFCQPLHIRWRPLALWNPHLRSTAFRVVYFDMEDRQHEAYCCVQTVLSGSFGSRRVRWIKGTNLRDFIEV